MSLLTELFGEEVIHEPIQQIKIKILSIPQIHNEDRSYLLRDWAAIVGAKLTAQDYKDVQV